MLPITRLRMAATFHLFPSRHLFRQLPLFLGLAFLNRFVRPLAPILTICAGQLIQPQPLSTICPFIPTTSQLMTTNICSRTPSRCLILFFLLLFIFRANLLFFFPWYKCTLVHKLAQLFYEHTSPLFSPFLRTFFPFFLNQSVPNPLRLQDL